MTHSLSEPIDNLIEESAHPPTADVLIVGSGYGGAVSAARLASAEGERRVYVLERGREYAPGDFPQDLGMLPGHVQFRHASDAEAIGNPDGLLDLRLGDDVDVLVGSGLGGTSLINANVVEEPEGGVFDQPCWPGAIREERRNPRSSLQAGFAKIRELLGTVAAVETDKYRALARLAAGAGVSCRPAMVLVTTPVASAAGEAHSRANAVGVHQSACTLCGNCVTGCNVGAKNTLAMNLIPLAKARGARFFTGATVLDLDREQGETDYPWRVRYRRTATIKTPLGGEHYFIRAKVVILAAGTLGSTEILLRTQAQSALRFSAMLGRRFSTNGDGIAMGYAQAQPVNALGRENQAAPNDVGPTISGIARTTWTDPRTGAAVRLTIEDAAIPAALVDVFGELVTTGAQFHRLSSFKLPAWLRSEMANGKKPDPIAVHPQALAHSQVLLVMGDDGAGGQLQLAQPAGGTLDDSQVKVVWPDARDNAALRGADAFFSAQDYGTGFDGGQYIPNPLWRLLPARAQAVMSGKLPDGRVMTVHPLGGCPMGEDPHSGVVNHAGQVFSDLGATYEGLYVLDGSIIPTALAVNPLLTISALAWRACELLLRQYAWKESTVSRVSGPLAQPELRTGIQPAVTSEAVGVALYEQLMGRLDCEPEILREMIGADRVERWSGYNGLIIQVEIKSEDVRTWLSDPGAQPLPAQAKLYVNPISAGDMQQTHLSHVAPAHLAREEPIAVAQGAVTLLARETSWWLGRYWRAAKAMWAYFKRRQSFLSVLRQEGTKLLAKRDRSAGAESSSEVSLREKIKGYVAVALMHAEYRVMAYRFEGGRDDLALVITGTKRLAWATDKPRLWDALMTLPVAIAMRGRGKACTVRGTLGIDLEYLATAGLPQVLHSPNLPVSLSAMGGVGMFFVRAILHTNFWEFGSPHYPVRPVVQRPEPRPLRVADGITIQPETTYLTVPLSRRDARTIPIALTRYAARAPGADPVLLIHGLAQGSLIYCTDTIEKNMAAAMWEAGYDVWLLDYRLSNALIRSSPLSGWSMEDIARYDIPIAVEHVYTNASRRPLRVFAHCVGATVTAMAVLRGWVEHDRLAKVAFNAIHPWITTSPLNSFRALVGGLFRERVANELLDPVPQVNPSASQAFMDRLAFSLARYGEEARDRHASDGALALSKAICDRMSFFYGRMWRHANLDERTHAAFADLVGPAPAEVYRHLYYFSKRGRLTDQKGRNAFLREANICDRWTFPTLFFHGELSNVFNPQSATDSAARFSLVQARRGKPFDVAKTQFGVRRVERYGHMDVVFAASASTNVYPAITAFFAGGAEQANAVPSDAFDIDSIVHSRIARNPSCGPVLRAAWVQDGAICLRFWAEVYDATTAPIQGIRVESNHDRVKRLREWRIRGAESSYRMIDVRLDPEATDIRLRILPDFVPSGGVGSQVRSPDAIGRALREEKMDPMVRRNPGGVDLVGGAQQEGKSDSQVLLSDTDGPVGTPTSAPEPTRVADDSTWGEVFLPARLGWLDRLLRCARGAASGDAMAFLVGSCRYPGTPFEYRLADAVFAGMLKHVVADGSGVDAVFFVGDQIYADATASILDAKAWRERYSLRYREAFTSSHLWRLLRIVPTHFTVDDHEFTDGWSGLPSIDSRLRREEETERKHRQARRAACSFLGSGRESTSVPFEGTGHTQHALWYALSHHCEVVCPAFVMDTRSERRLRERGMAGRAHMISELQLQALESWLQEASTRPEHPKFIFSASVVAPVTRDLTRHSALWRKEDGWAGYPATLGRIVGMIVERRFKNVVFVGGDLHLSGVARLTLHKRGHDPVTAWQIVASGLYAPLPFANRRPTDFDWNTDCEIPIPDTLTGITAHAGLLQAGPPHFVRVDATRMEGRWTLRVSANGADGAVLRALGPPPPQATVENNAWVIGMD